MKPKRGVRTINIPQLTIAPWMYLFFAPHKQGVLWNRTKTRLPEPKDPLILYPHAFRKKIFFAHQGGGGMDLCVLLLSFLDFFGGGGNEPCFFWGGVAFSSGKGFLLSWRMLGALRRGQRWVPRLRCSQPGTRRTRWRRRGR